MLAALHRLTLTPHLELAAKPYREPRATMRRILEEIAAERTRQDEKWGGPEHDDEHSIDDWECFILEHLNRVQGYDDAHGRKQLIRVAALAVAAIESLDRRAALSPAPTQEEAPDA